ncbi:MAG: hypothetical protein JJ975_01000 [Bacteroidia bacterium]|nr:hypothetical protein [Bacteroidia bacterium]
MSDRIRSLLKQIDTIVSRSGIDLICHRRGDIQELFGSKYQYAQSFISIYPELIPYAFPVRKRWQPEHHNVGIFDALALALVTVARA